MIIPKELKIGAHTYEIVVMDGFSDDGAITEGGRNIIFLNGSLNETVLEETLFHEIIHALNNGLKESDVEWIAQALYQVLKDNNLLK